MRRQAVAFLWIVICAMLLSPAMARPLTPSGGHTPLLSQHQRHFVQYRQCWRRFGPFVTQSTAWSRWRQARARGYAVSRGVVPCYGGGSRGYCFRVFYRC